MTDRKRTFAPEETKAKTEQLRSLGLPTMSEWGENNRRLMTPTTIEMNERLHASDLLMEEEEAATKDGETAE